MKLFLYILVNSTTSGTTKTLVINYQQTTLNPFNSNKLVTIVFNVSYSNIPHIMTCYHCVNNHAPNSSWVETKSTTGCVIDLYRSSGNTGTVTVMITAIGY